LNTPSLTPYTTRESFERAIEYEFSFSSVSGDRGCASKENEEFLKKRDIFNALCPRSLQEFIECLKSQKFIVERMLSRANS